MLNNCNPVAYDTEWADALQIAFIYLARLAEPILKYEITLQITTKLIQHRLLHLIPHLQSHVEHHRSNKVKIRKSDSKSPCQIKKYQQSPRQPF